MIKDLGGAEDKKQEIYDLKGESYLEIEEDVVAVIICGGVSIEKFDITSIPVNIKTTVSNGTYLVGKDLQPGVYKIQTDATDYGYVDTYSHINTFYENQLQSCMFQNGYIEIKDAEVVVVVRDTTLTKVDFENLPVDIKTTLSNGMYILGKDLTPGIYKTTGYYDSNCSVQTYSSIDTSNYENQLKWYSQIYGYIEITEQDKFVIIEQGEITKVDIDTMPEDIKTTINKEGIYLVGKDLLPGTYKVTKSGNQWASIDILSSISTSDVINSYSAAKDTIIEILETDVAIYLPWDVTIEKQ